MNKKNDQTYDFESHRRSEDDCPFIASLRVTVGGKMSIPISQSGVFIPTSGCLTAKTHDGIWNRRCYCLKYDGLAQIFQVFLQTRYVLQGMCMCRFLQFWLWYPNKCNRLDLGVFGCLALFECAAGGLYRCSLSIRQADKPAFLSTLPLIFCAFRIFEFFRHTHFQAPFWLNCKLLLHRKMKEVRFFALHSFNHSRLCDNANWIPFQSIATSDPIELLVKNTLNEKGDLTCAEYVSLLGSRCLVPVASLHPLLHPIDQSTHNNFTILETQT